MVKIKQNVAEWRIQKRISKAHLARQVGLSRSYITKLEQGRIQPSGRVMLRFAQYFERPVEAIFQLDDGRKSAAGRSEGSFPGAWPAPGD
jgi:putative transcriptional regulator